MTMAASGRIRRSVRFAQLEQQSGNRKPEAMPRRQRITVADHLDSPSFRNTQDWTGGLGISPSGRFRVIEDRRHKERSFTRQGIRRDRARIILIALAALMAVILLVELASIGAGQLRIQKLNSRLTAMEERNEALRAALTLSGGDISVCTEAVKLNLVSSSGVRPISLTAPTGAREKGNRRDAGFRNGNAGGLRARSPCSHLHERRKRTGETGRRRPGNKKGKEEK